MPVGLARSNGGGNMFVGGSAKTRLSKLAGGRQRRRHSPDSPTDCSNAACLIASLDESDGW